MVNYRIIYGIITVLFRYYKLDIKSNLEFLIRYAMDRLQLMSRSEQF
jgi:hypothetical protein